MPFSAEEYRQRYANLQAALAEIGADALLVTSEANFNYFTGYIAAHPWVSFSRNLIAILPREAPPLLIVPASLEEQAREQTWIEEIRTFSSIGFAPVAEIATAFRDRGLAASRIG